jgi:lipid II:glycine glycyltransferase (peptidoglycan interpeptide bridge formation enzyme)
MEWRRDVPDGSWDTQLFERGGHFLQGTHWGAFHQTMGRTVFFGQGDGWQCLALVERAHRVTRLYCPYGPVADSRESFLVANAELQKLAKREGAIFVRTEPLAPVTQQDLGQLGHKPALQNIQNVLTWVQDLTKPRDVLMSEFSATHRRYFNTAAKRGLRITTSVDPADIRIFLLAIRDLAKNNGMRPHDDAYYQAMADVLMPRDAARLYVAWHQDEPVATALAFDSPTTRYYAHAAGFREARKLHPGIPLMATMIFDAQERGQQTFDFVGVAPPGEPDHPWAGFTRFKQSFGGEYRHYLGTWEIASSPLYHGYRSAYKINHMLAGRKRTRR